MSTPHLTGTILGDDRHRPLLVLGPSLGTSVTALWGNCAALLADSFTVLGWDLPGHGASAPAAGPFTVADLAHGVLDLVDRTQAERGESGGSFVYAGDSVGGAVGLQLLLDAPDRIRAATLVCTGALIGTAESWRERATLVRAEGTAAVVDGSVLRWFAPGFVEHEPERAERLLQSLREADRGGYAYVCEALAAFDVRERLGEIRTPVLAVAGRHDQPTPVANLREIADGVPGAHLAVLDGVAHLAPVEDPAAVARCIRSGTAAATIDDVHAAGMRVRRAVLGDAHVDRAGAAGNAFTGDFQQFITRYAWGSIWTRPGLDRRSRSMITLTALVAGGHHEELELHLRAARTNGLSDAEIAEVLLQSAIYCGVPAANTAFRIAARVLAETDDAPPP